LAQHLTVNQDLNRDSNKTLKQSKLEPTTYTLSSIKMLLRLKLRAFGILPLTLLGEFTAFPLIPFDDVIGWKLCEVVLLSTKFFKNSLFP